MKAIGDDRRSRIEDRSEVEATAYEVTMVPEFGQAPRSSSVPTARSAKVIASEFDMIVHAHAALESSHNPDEQVT